MSSNMSAPEKEPRKDDFDAHGAFALGGRLRRLSDRIDRDAKSIYQEMGVEFEQRWFPVFNCLLGGQSQSVTEIADRLGVSHVSVSVTKTSLKDAGLVTSIPDKIDRRRSVLVLTEKGTELSNELAPLFAALNLAAAELNEEAGNAITAIARLEDALDRMPLSARTDRFMKRGQPK